MTYLTLGVPYGTLVSMTTEQKNPPMDALAADLRQYLATATEAWLYANDHCHLGSPHRSNAQHEYGKVCAYRAALDLLDAARTVETFEWTSGR